ETRRGFLQQDVAVGRHHLLADEPEQVGGLDSGPGPYDLLLAALGACTSMTVSFYARSRKWPLEDVTVRLTHQRVHETDCENCDTKPQGLDRITLALELHGTLSDEQRAKLAEIATRCPVHKTLTSKIDIQMKS
ncbi:MAG: OsmC family protein, partial [bacterium]|nr:OsmC family protein [bacterium]